MANEYLVHGRKDPRECAIGETVALARSRDEAVSGLRASRLSLSPARLLLALVVLTLFPGCDAAKRVIGERSGKPAEPASVDFHEEVATIPARLKKKSGCNPCRALVIHIRKEHVEAELQDWRDPLKADAWGLGAYAGSGSEPVMMLGDKPTIESMKAATFDLEHDVDWSKLPGIIKRGTKLAEVDEIEEVGVHVRNHFMTGRPSVAVAVKGRRAFNTVDFDGNGRLLDKTGEVVDGAAKPGSGSAAPTATTPRPACTCKSTDPLCDCL